MGETMSGDPWLIGGIVTLLLLAAGLLILSRKQRSSGRISFEWRTNGDREEEE